MVTTTTIIEESTSTDTQPENQDITSGSSMLQGKVNEKS